MVNNIMMENMNEYISTTINAGVYIAVAFIIFLIGRYLYQVFRPGIDVKHELVEKDNFAFSVSYVGYFVGLILAIGSAIIGPSNGLLIDVQDIFIYGILAIVLLNISGIINDKFILSKFNVNKEIIEDQNTGTGVVEAANYVATGLIILGAVSGENNGLIGGMLSAIVFWAAGQILLIITARVYNKMLSYDIHEYIEKDNVAVGVGFAGVLIAIANIIRFSLTGDFDSWVDTLPDLVYEFILGMIMIPIVRLLTDKILLPGRKLTDELINQEKPNIGAALIEAFAYIGGSVLITWVI